ncbi:ATP-binding protein [Acinetobacter bereziniae]|uniref:ATP-binding protein n=1 Tax=Acinetobacter bereziniae TaxID=106648 RepID=A0A8I1AMR1_ACIBZ|nr:ATP-binding protein [Acinetobacter bereziniae]QQC82788.1 ATP-binding protein [Acinetobacter bereziniae]UUN95930.1 ATP-binding protein [Acinetobacter bereziniae]
MLISFSFENVLSFKSNQYLSLVATNKKKDNILPQNYFSISEKENLLKSTLVFGANGSGKTNLLACLSNMYNIVIHSLETLKNKNVNYLPPFLLDHVSKNKNSEYEIEFYAKNKIKYRYGFSLKNKIIDEEWFYYTPKTRETLLFHRKKNQIEMNKTFDEGSKFVNGNNEILKTKETVPFLSVLASFDGQHSNAIVECFLALNFFDINNEEGDLKETLRLWKEDKEFRLWALPVLKSIGIHDIRFENQTLAELEKLKEKISIEKEKLNNLNIRNDDLKDKAQNLFSGLFDLITSTPLDEEEISKEINLSTIKLIRVIDGEDFPLPFSLESSGTQKLIHLLGAMYIACKEGEILIIDEFDVKFHTLLSKYVFRLFNECSGEGQIIATVHDTNLMDTDYFRRDQIWLMNKNAKGESQIYSLVEFKELASNILNKNYSSEYLKGFYDAIPLFQDELEVLEIMDEA